MHVVATAGHVDHGKSSLVLALTGTDPDRWAEEKTRGLTIDLGFAHGPVGANGATAEVAWVDVPGHVRFIRNMLAGVGAVDAVVLVVAATEGWKPQSEEHLRILELLGLRSGIVALTKADLVDSARIAAAHDEVRAHLDGSGLAGAPIVAVDSLSGRGLTDLSSALAQLLAATPTSADVGRPRLWVDRCFSARGAGTVVTGTLAGGALSTGDTLTVVGPGAAGRHGDQVRVRGLQVHGTARDTVSPGHRVAVNVVGAGRPDIVRGDALVRAGQWEPTATADATLTVLPSLGHPVSRRGAYALYAGTGEHVVGVRILGPQQLEPGEDGLVRLHLPVRVPWLPGDRYVLREHGRGETVGGGEILDVDPVLPASRARPNRSIERVVGERGWVTADHLERLTGRRLEPTVGQWVVHPDALDAAGEQLRAAVASAGPYGLEVATLDDRLRAVAEHAGDIEVRNGWARQRSPSAASPADADAGGGAGAGTDTDAGGEGARRAALAASAAARAARAAMAGVPALLDPAAAPGPPTAPGPSAAPGVAAAGAGRVAHPWLDALDASPWSPPAPHDFDVPRPLLRQLVQEGTVVERDGVWFAASAVRDAAVVVARLLGDHPDGVTVAVVRDALGSSRKHILPLLAHLDATGVTRRRGDVRIGGPRLPAA